MTRLRIVKRTLESVDLNVDYNPSIFRYFLEGQEIKRMDVKNGLKSAFLGMLDELILPNESDFSEYSNFNFFNPVASNIVLGGTTVTVNTYTGDKYKYRLSTSIVVRAAQPLTRGAYTGDLYIKVFSMATFQYSYTISTDMYAAIWTLLQDGTYDDVEAWGGTLPVTEERTTTPAGYFIAILPEVGTHGIDDDGIYRPLSYWNETITTQPPANEYTGFVRESKSGFELDTKKIGLNLTLNGEALNRYNPIDLITFAELIKLNYNYRDSATYEGNI